MLNLFEPKDLDKKKKICRSRKQGEGLYIYISEPLFFHYVSFHGRRRFIHKKKSVNPGKKETKKLQHVSQFRSDGQPNGQVILHNSIAHFHEPRITSNATKLIQCFPSTGSATMLRRNYTKITDAKRPRFIINRIDTRVDITSADDKGKTDRQLFLKINEVNSVEWPHHHPPSLNLSILDRVSRSRGIRGVNEFLTSFSWVNNLSYNFVFFF